MRWLADLKATYFSNATAARDYRVQLRGNRSVLLFGLYLAVLIGVAFVVYSQQVSARSQSVVEAQQMLRQFYMTIMFLLGGMIALISPALSATTIVQERNRRSFDLVFSAPVTPKYYLVGKVIGSYRYTWMLLVLSLPVTAASVVLGGATWSDVLIAYLLLSMQALFFTSVALLMSTVATKAVSAVLWTYAIMFTLLIAGSSAGVYSTISTRTSREQTFFIALSPFGVSEASDTYTTVLGHEVPNWILASIVILFLVRLVLLTAGSRLSGYAGKEGRMLRIHALAYGFAAMLYFGYALQAAGISATERTQILGNVLCWWLVPLCVTLPFMTCYAYEGERQHWPNGFFKPSRAFDGTPAGALPFVWLYILCCFLGAYGGAYWSTGVWPGVGALSYLAYGIGFWTFFWAMGRLTSLTGNLRNARTLQFASFLLVVILPVPFLTAVTLGNFDSKEVAAWYLWVMYPLVKTEPEFIGIAAVYGVVMLLAGLGVARYAEERFSHRIRVDLVEDERLYSRA